ncbi:hypothetical protein DOY81_011206 [Sarcophaga bullata]|nr:hypothetical protein DOY81_011206 [Sarcophaga bullata]
MRIENVISLQNRQNYKLRLEWLYHKPRKWLTCKWRSNVKKRVSPITAIIRHSLDKVGVPDKT